MKQRTCPCCNQKVSFGYFLKKMLFQIRQPIAFETHIGILCPNCSTSIISGERKIISERNYIFGGMIPFGIFGFQAEPFNFFTFLFYLSASIAIVIFQVYRTYSSIEFICDDQNSDEYNENGPLFTGMKNFWKR